LAHVHDMGRFHLHPTAVTRVQESFALGFKRGLTEVGPWAVVIVEGLEIFWAFRKGKGCLGVTGPDTAAIMCGRREGSQYRWEEGQTAEVCKESIQDGLKNYQAWCINVTEEDKDGMAVQQASGASSVRAKLGGLWQSMWSNVSRRRGSRHTKWAHIRKGLMPLAAQRWRSPCGSKRWGWR